jgi:hypothetical protein
MKMEAKKPKKEDFDDWFETNQPELKKITNEAIELLYKRVSSKDWSNGFKKVAYIIISKRIWELADEKYKFSKLKIEEDVNNSMFG